MTSASGETTDNRPWVIGAAVAIAALAALLTFIGWQANSGDDAAVPVGVVGDAGAGTAGPGPAGAAGPSEPGMGAEAPDAPGIAAVPATDGGQPPAAPVQQAAPVQEAPPQPEPAPVQEAAPAQPEAAPVGTSDGDEPTAGSGVGGDEGRSEPGTPDDLAGQSDPGDPGDAG